MLYLVVADNKPYRAKRASEIISTFPNAEIISVDDAMMALEDLEQFLHPSLFVADAPIIHARFLLEGNDIDVRFARQLVASPTVFLFEELAMPTAALTALKKYGATVYAGEKTKAKKPAEDIFAATACITAKDKKARWLAYRAAVTKQPIEAILGILYWKVRTLAAKEGKGGTYARLYGEMLDAQSRAWRTGAPLEALIEKVILMQ
jgi:hypothetical protein